MEVRQIEINISKKGINFIPTVRKFIKLSSLGSVVGVEVEKEEFIEYLPLHQQYFEMDFIKLVFILRYTTLSDSEDERFMFRKILIDRINMHKEELIKFSNIFL